MNVLFLRITKAFSKKWQKNFSLLKKSHLFQAHKQERDSTIDLLPRKFLVKSPT